MLMLLELSLITSAWLLGYRELAAEDFTICGFLFSGSREILCSDLVHRKLKLSVKNILFLSCKKVSLKTIEECAAKKLK